ncbi:uroporphyrin-III C-methyltransferase/precorrin-2 dehydrogenase/sirohydrochlorin ferrochelatase [Knoellia remsis]|uniref:precorrin-2 dehydrogenase n=1 Tax=Knoellia remsis TaxID=407159 RepID=A0A2T0UZ46_9MICO|nr:NAD(P)-dependent oxidoreductase [Knoellia remsis]PRY63192.1 uroporphyrin-III C-methyltransferase/precorrin-2 dehydrogenase/sirohydrochlorin ferrochelatase [Knoellia remsis]
MTTLIGVDLVGRAVLVAGGGPVAAAKARRLVDDGAIVHVVTPVVCREMLDLCDRVAVSWSQREVALDDVTGSWFVVASTGDLAVDRALCERATSERVFSVCAGASEHGTARTPAVTEHAGLRVGVVSVGRPDPGRVVAVRNALAQHLESADIDLRPRRTAPGRRGRVVLVGGSTVSLRRRGDEEVVA